MTAKKHAGGIVAMLVERFESQHLGRLLALKRAVDAGGRLAEHQSAFLDGLFREIMLSKRYVDHHPEYQSLYTRVVGLYSEIVGRALENERRAFSSDRIPSDAQPAEAML